MHALIVLGISVAYEKARYGLSLKTEYSVFFCESRSLLHKVYAQVEFQISGAIKKQNIGLTSMNENMIHFWKSRSH